MFCILLYCILTYVHVFFLGRTSGNHGGHAVAAQAVVQHRGHHRVSIGHVGSILLGQGHNNLKPKRILLNRSVTVYNYHQLLSTNAHLFEIVQRQIDVLGLG